jgi:hypothetical protein
MPSYRNRVRNLSPRNQNRGVKRLPGSHNGRVRRQGLEPRTRGLRVRCSVRRYLRYYLHLHACTSEDMPLPWKTQYRTMTAAARPYRDIRANMEQTSVRIGLDHHGRGRLSQASEGTQPSAAKVYRRQRYRCLTRRNTLGPSESGKAADTIRDPCWQCPDLTSETWSLPGTPPFRVGGSQGKAQSRRVPIGRDNAPGRVERAVEEHRLDANVVVEPFQMP